jgi:N-acetylglucosaminyl-diphospho-decaprenol L-rhamnosyltransferase
MVTIVIVNWNSGPLLERCIRSIQEHASGCEIVVVDNASEDSSLSFLPQPGLPLLLLKNQTNAGFAAAANQGWRTGRGEPVLFLNPDAECLAGGVESLAQQLARDPGIWAAGGCLLDSSGSPQVGFNVRAFPSIASVAAEMLLLDEIWKLNPWTRRYRMSGWDHNSVRDVDQPAAACLMVRRTVLESLGGFDERFRPAWFEDVDLCKRMRDAGGRIVFEPQARFLHHGGISLQSLSAAGFLRYFHTNQILYFEKHHGRRAAARVRRLIITGLYLRALLASLGAPRSVRAKASSPSAYRQVARYFAGRGEAGS